MRYKILVVDDNEDILESLEDILEGEEFNVLTTDSGRDTIELAREKEPDLIILDLMLPDLDGLKVCRILREDNSTAHIPIIILTARTEISERIEGLETGADDYVTKPFSPKELVARIKAVLRRTIFKGQPDEILEKGGICINLTKHTVEVKKKPIKLTAKEFDLLFLLLRKAGRVLSEEYLLSAVWGYDREINTKTLDVHISRLRKKLGSEMAKKIETIASVGYTFTE